MSTVIRTILKDTQCENIGVFSLVKNLEPKKRSLFARYKLILMSQEERGGIVGIYSTRVKITLKVGLVPMETTLFRI